MENINENISSTIKDNKNKDTLIINKKKVSRFNKKNEGINLLKIFCLFLSILFILTIKTYITNYNDLIKKERINRNKDIIDVQFYQNFEKMKKRFINEPILNPYLNEIKILSHIFHKNLATLKNNKTNVQICMGLNNKYVYHILVSIESILFNCNKTKTFITIHILCAPEIKENYLFMLKSLVYQYPSNFEFIFYNMGNIFISNENLGFSQIVYYRLLAPIIFDVDRIFHLDGDTLTFKDLSEVYQINLNDNYVFGFLDFLPYGIDYLGIKSEKYINAGVILLNLEKIRNDKKIFDIINIMTNKTKLHNNDQTIINYIFYPKIGIFQSKYVTFNFYNELHIESFTKLVRTKITSSEIIDALKDPTIIHFIPCRPKVWDPKTKCRRKIFWSKQNDKCCCKYYHNLWYFYANKTEYYKEILKNNRKKLEKT